MDVNDSLDISHLSPLPAQDKPNTQYTVEALRQFLENPAIPDTFKEAIRINPNLKNLLIEAEVVR